MHAMLLGFYLQATLQTVFKSALFLQGWGETPYSARTAAGFSR